MPSQADKRAHHNALERKRRDHIKDSFHGLRDSVPALQGEKVRGKYIHFLHSKENQSFFKGKTRVSRLSQGSATFFHVKWQF